MSSLPVLIHALITDFASKGSATANPVMRELTAPLKLVQIIALITDTVKIILSVSASQDSKVQIAH